MVRYSLYDSFIHNTSTVLVAQRIEVKGQFVCPLILTLPRDGEEELVRELKRRRVI